MAEEDSNSTRTALVLFGTETGTSQDLAFETGRILDRLHFETDIEDIDNVPVQLLGQYTLVVFVISTTGQGDFPTNARRFWKTLLLKRLSSTFLSGLDYALVGLGDTSYPKFNLAARKLHKRLRQLGAQSILEPCEADEQGEDSTDGAFLNWSQLFRARVLEIYPLPDGQEPVPDDQVLKSKWTLEKAGTEEHVNGHNTVQGSTTARAGSSVTQFDIPFEVTLEQNDRMTPTDHWQDVRFLKLKATKSVQYLPGDSLAIRPKNTSSDVQQVIQLMQWEDIAESALRFRLNKKSRFPDKLPDPTLGSTVNITLRQLLTENLDINAIPRRSFFAAIANFTTNVMQQERLREFTDPQYLDEYYDYTTRPRRSILEILQEFDSVKIPWQETINVFPILRPRQFSIASGGLLNQDGTTFELLVAIVKYRTVIKRIREGICTKYLANLLVGSKLYVVLKTEGRFHNLQELASKRHLLVGAGTGMAPLRAVVHEKANTSLPSTLIFGCRNAQADYFFKDEWEKLSVGEGEAKVQIITAFSRDQKLKVYVQDKIRDNASLVLQHLFDPTSVTIICGSSGAMPKAIRQAFVDVLSSPRSSNEYPVISTAEADQFLAKMEKEGRYKQETW